MGISLHYRILPESFAPWQDPLTAHSRVTEAVDIAIPVLPAAGLPCKLSPPNHNERTGIIESVGSYGGGRLPGHPDSREQAEFSTSRRPSKGTYPCLPI